ALISEEKSIEVPDGVDGEVLTLVATPYNTKGVRGISKSVNYYYPLLDIEEFWFTSPSRGAAANGSDYVEFRVKAVFAGSKRPAESAKVYPRVLTDDGDVSSAQIEPYPVFLNSNGEAHFRVMNNKPEKNTVVVSGAAKSGYRKIRFIGVVDGCDNPVDSECVKLIDVGGGDYLSGMVSSLWFDKNKIAHPLDTNFKSYVIRNGSPYLPVGSSWVITHWYWGTSLNQIDKFRYMCDVVFNSAEVAGRTNWEPYVIEYYHSQKPYESNWSTSQILNVTSRNIDYFKLPNSGSIDGQLTWSGTFNVIPASAGSPRDGYNVYSTMLNFNTTTPYSLYNYITSGYDAQASGLSCFSKNGR
ncbi:hypothetical protein K6327_004522, partial [Vibrio vulnificus]|nr:hypothetical protein [Vibrio vulnificus]